MTTKRPPIEAYRFPDQLISDEQLVKIADAANVPMLSDKEGDCAEKLDSVQRLAELRDEVTNAFLMGQLYQKISDEGATSDAVAKLKQIGNTIERFWEQLGALGSVQNPTRARHLIVGAMEEAAQEHGGWAGYRCAPAGVGELGGDDSFSSERLDDLIWETKFFFAELAGFIRSSIEVAERQGRSPTRESSREKLEIQCLIDAYENCSGRKFTISDAGPEPSGKGIKFVQECFSFINEEASPHSIRKWAKQRKAK